jgi:hypothetical protein
VSPWLPSKPCGTHGYEIASVLVTADFTDTSTETREIGGQTMFWLLEAPEERRVDGLSAGVRP